MAALIQLLGYAIELVAPAVALIGGIWAINRLRSPEMRARADRRSALRLVVIVASVATLLTTVVFASLATMFSSNGPNYLIGLPFGAAFGAFVALAAILGYVLTTRRGATSSATAGVLAGPVVLIVASVLGGMGATALEQASLASNEASHQQTIADRSTKVHASVDRVEVQTAHGGSDVASVNLSVTLSTEILLNLDPLAKEPDPRFHLLPPDSSAGLESVLPPGSPTTIEAGSSHTYELAFSYPDEILNATSGTYVPGHPGTWTLEISFTDIAAGEYLVKIPVEVR